MRVRASALAVLLAAPLLVGAGSVAADEVAVDEVTVLRDPEILESSGLVVLDEPGPSADRLLVTVNDSGDAGRVFAVDPATGETVGTTSWAEEPEDVEALAPAGPSSVWVADVGDNLRRRDVVRVAEVEVGRGDRVVEPAWRELAYPDGPRDAESLLAHPVSGELLVVSKGVLGGEFYRVPAQAGPDGRTVLEPLGPALGLATDAAFWPDGRHLVVRNYDRAVVQTWPGLEVLASLDLPDQPQGEGVAVTPDGEVWLSSEGREQPVLRLALPADVRAVVLGEADASEVEPPGARRADDVPLDERPLAGAGSTPWLLLGGLVVGVLVVGVLLRSLRPR